MTLILQVFYSVFSGLILATAIPNELFLFGCPFLAFFALIPFYFAIKNCRTYGQAFLIAFVQMLVTHLASSFWLAYFKDFAIFTLGGSALYTAFEGGVFGFLFYLPYSRRQNNVDEIELKQYSLKRCFYEYPSFRVLYFAAVYTAYEWVKSTGFLGYPWGTLSSAMYKFSLFTQLAAITGTYGISFLIALFNALLAQGYILLVESKKIHFKKRFFTDYCLTATVFLMLFGLSLCYGFVQLHKERIPTKYLTTIMVQQNSDPWKQKNDTESVLLSEELTEKQLEELRLQNKNANLIVWSEGCLTKMFPTGYYHYRSYPEANPLVPFLKSHKVPLLAGGSYYIRVEETETNKYFNSAHIFDKDGNYLGSYSKLHLVPFPQIIPSIEYPIIKKILTKVVGISAGWTQGDQLVYFDIPCSYYGEKKPEIVKIYNLSQTKDEQAKLEKGNPTVRICTPICFDDSFTDVMRPLFNNGAELFVNITDDSWSLKKSSETQHFVIASYRAIEYRTTLIRSANAGYSVVLDPTGKILVDQPMFEASSASYDVPIYSRTITTYAKYGNWLPYSLIVILFIISVIMKKTFSPTDFIPSERSPEPESKIRKSKTVKNTYRAIHAKTHRK
ncbi:MAG: apolipoprotein N-acyltransferase [Treponema sp.]|nr:apolipoprotein N-acyltransferase [Treponema sp.]